MILYRVKKFINENKELVRNNAFKELYQKALSREHGIDCMEIGNMTETFLNAGINPLKYVEYVPDYYLYGSQTVIDTMVFPDNVRYIGESAFQESKIKYLDLNLNISDIAENAFWCCHELKYVNIKDINQLTKINFRGPGSNPIKQLWHTPHLLINNVRLEDIGYKITFDDHLPVGISRAEHRADPNFSIEPITKWSNHPVMLTYNDDKPIAIDYSRFKF